MYAIYVLLFLGAFFLFAYCAVFVLGALIHLASLAREALRTTRRTRDGQAAASQPRPAPQLPRPSKAAGAEARVEVGAAYGCA